MGYSLTYYHCYWTIDGQTFLLINIDSVRLNKQEKDYAKV